LIAGRPTSFACCIHHLKVKFYRVFNSIYAKSKGANSESELVIVEQLKSYCLPFLLYGMEAVSLTDSNAHALDSCINRAMYRIFGVGDHENVKQISHAFGLFSIKRINRKEKTEISRSVMASNLLLFLMSVSF